jgi:hypothetical protein
MMSMGAVPPVPPPAPPDPPFPVDTPTELEWVACETAPPLPLLLGLPLLLLGPHPAHTPRMPVTATPATRILFIIFDTPVHGPLLAAEPVVYRLRAALAQGGRPRSDKWQ